MSEASIQQNFNFGFSTNKSEILIHLSQWQYWWWFWFSLLWTLYFYIIIRVFSKRTFNLNIILNTSSKSRGKWGDFLIALIPVSWCCNILINSNFILRLIEWQNESSLFTIRIQGKQWYWVYKYDPSTHINLKLVPKNIGHNNWRVTSKSNSYNFDTYYQAINLGTQLEFDEIYNNNLIENSLKNQNKIPVNLQNEKLNFVEKLKIKTNSNKYKRLIKNNVNRKELANLYLEQNKSRKKDYLMNILNKIKMLTKSENLKILKKKYNNILLKSNKNQIDHKKLTKMYISKNPSKIKKNKIIIYSKLRNIFKINIFNVNKKFKFHALYNNYKKVKLSKNLNIFKKLFKKHIALKLIHERSLLRLELKSTKYELKACIVKNRFDFDDSDYSCYTPDYTDIFKKIKLFSSLKELNKNNIKKFKKFFPKYNINTYKKANTENQQLIKAIYLCKKKLYKNYKKLNIFKKIEIKHTKNKIKNLILNIVKHKNKPVSNLFFEKIIKFLKKNTKKLNFKEQFDKHPYKHFIKKKSFIITSKEKTIRKYITNQIKLKKKNNSNKFLEKNLNIGFILETLYKLSLREKINKFNNNYNFYSQLQFDETEDTTANIRHLNVTTPFRLLRGYLNSHVLDLLQNNQKKKLLLFNSSFNSTGNSISEKESQSETFWGFRQKKLDKFDKYEFKPQIIYDPFTLEASGENNNYINSENVIITSDYVSQNNNFDFSESKILDNKNNINNRILTFNSYTQKYEASLKHNRYRSELIPVTLAKRLLQTKRTLVLPIHLNITLITNSYDVVHSWFIPSLGLKLDCVPGRSTHHTLYIENIGFYYGQCAEICGRYHHHMPIRVCAISFDQFCVWWNSKGLKRIHRLSNINKDNNSNLTFR